MKYFIDTEFIEGFHKPLFGKKRHFIDLISIGIVCEDGREMYAISTEFDEKDADTWVKTNVISQLPNRRVSQFDSPSAKEEARRYKSNEQIKNDIIGFTYPPSISFDGVKAWFPDDREDIEFYGYYADYDWVVFCSLFGRMIDLPKSFPMYCRDIKQMVDEKYNTWLRTSPVIDRARGANITLETYKNLMTRDEKYPHQTDEHNALADARWNRDFYNFLMTYK